MGSPFKLLRTYSLSKIMRGMTTNDEDGMLGIGMTALENLCPSAF